MGNCNSSGSSSVSEFFFRDAGFLPVLLLLLLGAVLLPAGVGDAVFAVAAACAAAAAAISFAFCSSSASELRRRCSCSTRNIEKMVGEPTAASSSSSFASPVGDRTEEGGTGGLLGVIGEGLFAVLLLREELPEIAIAAGCFSLTSCKGAKEGTKEPKLPERR